MILMKYLFIACIIRGFPDYWENENCGVSKAIEPYMLFTIGFTKINHMTFSVFKLKFLHFHLLLCEYETFSCQK